MKLRFLGDFKKLDKCVLRTGIPGKWREHENRQKQYRTDDGAMLSWWKSTKTLLFEGKKPAIPKLKRAFLRAASKMGLLEGERDAGDEIADLGGVISEIAKLKRRQNRMRIEIAELKEGRS